MSVQQEPLEQTQEVKQIQEPEVRQPNPEIVETMQSGREKLMGVLHEGVDTASIEDYSDPIGRSAHGHGLSKHDVRQAFNVNPNLIRNEFDLTFIPNGHEVLWYMMENKESLIESNTSVFVDVNDNNTARWGSIEATRQKAPIKPQCEARIKVES